MRISGTEGPETPVNGRSGLNSSIAVAQCVSFQLNVGSGCASSNCYGGTTCQQDAREYLNQRGYQHQSSSGVKKGDKGGGELASA